MRKTLLALILVVVALVFLWQGGETTSSGPAALIQEVMARAGTAPESGEALYWGTVAPEFLDVVELESLAEEILEALGIEAHGPRERLEEAEYHLVDIPGRLPSGVTARVILQSVTPPAGGSPAPREEETFLLIQLQEEGGAFKVLEAGERLPQLLRPFGRGELTLDVTAYLPGRLTVEEMANRARDLLQAAGAEPVEEMTGENLVSFTGYTPRIRESLDLGHEKININVALRYDSYREMTALRLGLPLIGGSY